MEKKYTVYVHTFPDGKMYFGKTSLDVRVRCGKDGSGYRYNEPMWQAIQEVGWDNIEHSIIKTGLSEEVAATLETHYIEEYQTTNPLFGYNHSKGDGNTGGVSWCKGKHLPEETRNKMSEAHKGDKHPLYGKHPSEETCKRISEAKKGKHKPKPKWLTPDGSIIEMDKSNAHKHHPDWKQID